MKIFISMSDTVHRQAGKNVKSVIVFVHNKTNKKELDVVVNLRNERTIYVQFLTTNKDIQNKLTNYVLKKTVADELNEKFGSDFDEGIITSGGPDGVSVQYTARTTLGSLLDK
jgi:intein-encoded DNA endonuclease-like protein